MCDDYALAVDVGEKEYSAECVMLDLKSALVTLKSYKPTERSELSRRYAVCITEMEKVIAYYKTFIADGVE